MAYSTFYAFVFQLIRFAYEHHLSTHPMYDFDVDDPVQQVPAFTMEGWDFYIQPCKTEKHVLIVKGETQEEISTWNFYLRFLRGR